MNFLRVIIVNLIFYNYGFAADSVRRNEDNILTSFLRQLMVPVQDGEKIASPSKRKRESLKGKTTEKASKLLKSKADQHISNLKTPVRKVSRQTIIGSKEALSPYREVRIYKVQQAFLDKRIDSLSPFSQKVYQALRLSLYPIKNPNFIEKIKKNQKKYSPIARHFLSRTEVKAAKERGEIESLPARAFSEYDELPPETIQEKLARKKRETEFFLFLNHWDLSKYKNLEEQEAAYWLPFWQYISEEKNKVLKGKRAKIRPEELQDIATIGSLSYYQQLEVVGTTFFYHPDFMDFTLKDKKGFTNLERLQKGQNPIGWDGLTMEIHHVTMFNESVLVLLSRTLHEGPSLKRITNHDKATLHPQPDYYARTKSSDIDRRYFARQAKDIREKLIRIGNQTDRKIAQTLPLSIDERKEEITAAVSTSSLPVRRRLDF